jgi:hypothetical protein
MNSQQHLGERRFEKRPLCLDAEIGAAPLAALTRGLWITALIVFGVGVAALIVFV